MRTSGTVLDGGNNALCGSHDHIACPQHPVFSRERGVRVTSNRNVDRERDAQYAEIVPRGQEQTVEFRGEHCLDQRRVTLDRSPGQNGLGLVDNRIPPAVPTEVRATGSASMVSPGNSRANVPPRPRLSAAIASACGRVAQPRAIRTPKIPSGYAADISSGSDMIS